MSFIIKNLPILIVITPLMFSLIVAVLNNNRLAWTLSTFAYLLTMIFSILLCFEVTSKTNISYYLGNWPPPLGIEYVIDTISIIPIMIISVIGLIATLFAHNFFTLEIDKKLVSKTYSLWLLTIAGLIGLITTADAFNLFVFLEISSLSAVALVALGSKVDRKALVAGYNYLILGAVGATFYVIGVGLLYGVTGTLNMGDLAQKIPALGLNKSVIVAFTFMMLGIIVKAAVLPLHIWLTNSYREELSRSNKSFYCFSISKNTRCHRNFNQFGNYIQISRSIKEMIVSCKWSQTICVKSNVSRSNMSICLCG